MLANFQAAKSFVKSNLPKGVDCRGGGAWGASGDSEKKKEKSHLRCKTHKKKCPQSFLKINSLYNRGVEVRVSLFTEVWCLQQHSST